MIFRNGRFLLRLGEIKILLTRLHLLTLIHCFLKSCSVFVFGSHQKWCEPCRAERFCVAIHTISGVIRNSKIKIDFYSSIWLKVQVGQKNIGSWQNPYRFFEKNGV